MKKLIVLLLTGCLFSGRADAYGPRGHHLVGAIADRRLANKPVAGKINQLLDGLSLETAAQLPDDIKDWDTCGQKREPVNGSKRIKAELRAFLDANPCNGHPSHLEFHYTDVPVAGTEKYADGTVGRSEFDIVQMISFCVRVLEGQEPETNDRAITKSVAVILLAHYLGDIHQPLHVGAEYFDAGGHPFEPTPNHQGFADQGGNMLDLYTFYQGDKKFAGVFHGYWDGQTVENAFGKASMSTIASKLAKSEPSSWKLQGDVETWARQMADEIMPLAREAHERLEFKSIKLTAGNHDISSGRAEEKKNGGGKYYAVWAYETVKDEIHKAGWRLAALLEEALQ